MTYQVRWTELAERQLEKLDKFVRERIYAGISSMAEDPLSHVKRLRGVNLYSFRVGDYRAILSIENRLMVIIVVEVGHRSSIYRKY